MDSPLAASPNTPPRSRTSSRSKSPSLSISIPDLPPLTGGSEPSNTLLCTNLSDPKIFTTTATTRLRNVIETSLQQATAGQLPTGAEPLTSDDILHSLSPLPSLRRIVLTFTTTAAAFYIRSLLDGTTLGSGDRIRIFFGADTPLEAKDPHLQAPRASKQFFISPPPSPPAGWTSREEDPPNKTVHATDLATILGTIGRRNSDDLSEASLSPTEPIQASAPAPVLASLNTSVDEARPRSDSRTIVYQPQDHGHSPLLPAIAVEDTTESPTALSPDDASVGGGKLMAHTARPPVELM